MSAATQRILKALSVFSGVQAMGIVCSVVRAKLIALWIGPVGVALFGIFNSATDMISNATQLNMRQSAVRDVSKASDANTARVVSSVRWWARNLGFFGALVMIILSPGLSLISFGSTDMWWGFALLSIAMILLAFIAGEQIIMQGIGNLRSLAKSSMWGITIGTLVSVPMYYYMGIDCIVPSLLAFAIAGSLAVKAYGIKMPKIALSHRENMAIGKDFIRLGAYFTISSLAANAASYIFLSYLNNVASETVTGCFQAGNTIIIRYVGIAFSAVGMEYYPRLSKIADRPLLAQKVVNHETIVILCVITPMVMLLAVLAPWVVRLLYSEAFLSIVPMVTIGIGGAILRAISYCMSFVIIARGDGKIFVATDVVSAIIGLTLNVLGYNMFGLVGLGISYVLWYGIYALIIGSVYRWRYGMRLSLRTCVVIILSLLLCGTVICGVQLLN